MRPNRIRPPSVFESECTNRMALIGRTLGACNVPLTNVALRHHLDLLLTVAVDLDVLGVDDAFAEEREQAGGAVHQARTSRHPLGVQLRGMFQAFSRAARLDRTDADAAAGQLLAAGADGHFERSLPLKRNLDRSVGGRNANRPVILGMAGGGNVQRVRSLLELAEVDHSGGIADDLDRFLPARVTLAVALPIGTPVWSLTLSRRTDSLAKAAGPKSVQATAIAAIAATHFLLIAINLRSLPSRRGTQTAGESDL